jgi:Rrf2 family protein
MALFALHHGKSPLRASDITKEVNIPSPYLSKILRQLVSAKLLVGTKGRGGGFVIGKSPDIIRFIDILHAIQGKEKVPKCVFGLSACSDKQPCILHNRWKEAKQTFEAWSQKTTLKDVQDDIKKLPSEELSARLEKMGYTKKIV